MERGPDVRKIVTSLVAVAALVAGVLVAVAIVDSSAEAQESEGEAPTVIRHSDLLADALSELVDEGVINESQADAVRERVTQKREERRQERAERFDAFRDGHRGHGFRFPFLHPDLLDDGVLDADELADLMESNPLFAEDGPLADLLEDGELSLEELKDRIRSFEFEFRGPGFRGFGEGFGPFGSDTPTDADSSSA